MISLLVCIYICLLNSLIIFKLLKNSDLPINYRKNVYFSLLVINIIFSLTLYFILEYQNYFISDRFHLGSYLLFLFFQTHLVFLYFYLKSLFHNIYSLSFESFFNKINYLDFCFISFIILTTYSIYYMEIFKNNSEILNLLFFILLVSLIISFVIELFISAIIFILFSLIDCFYLSKIIKFSLFKEIEYFISKDNFDFLKKLDLYIDNDNPLILKNNKIAIKLNIEEDFEQLIENFVKNNIHNKKFFHLLKTKKEFNVKIISISIGLNDNKIIKFKPITDFIDLNNENLKLNLNYIYSLLKMESY